MTPLHLPCDRIEPDPRSPGYRPDEVAVLAESIRENGLLRPILVRPTHHGFVIVHGERRWRAVQALGHATIVAWPVLDFLHRSSGAL